MAVETRTAVRNRKVRVLPPDRPRTAHPLGRLVLDGRLLEMQIGDRLLSASLARAIDTPNAITLGLWNGDRAIFNGILGRRVMTRQARLELDGLGYIASGFSKQGDTVSIPFEDETIVILKRDGKDKPLHVSRDNMTRFEFCATMIRAAGVAVIVLDEQVIQPVAGRKKLKAELAKARRQAAKTEKTKTRMTRAEARGITGAGLTVQGAPANARQRRVIAGVLAECARLGCSIEVDVATVCCVIQESGAGAKTTKTGNDDVGLFQQGRNWIDVVDVLDPAKTTQAFLTGAINGGGAPGWKQLNGSLTRVPGGIEAAVKRVQVSVGGYQQWEAEARKWVAAGIGASVAATDDQGTAYINNGTFERRNGESTYGATKRLLDEVHCVIFAREGVIVLASEPALMRGPSTRTFEEYTEGTESIDFDGARGLRVGELSTTSVVGRYDIDPGEPVDVAGLPPVQRKWLLSAVTQDLLSPATPAQISAKRPTQPDDEPSGTVVTPTAGAGGTDTAEPGSFRAACIEIAARRYPYIWGGGHGRAPATPTPARPGTPSTTASLTPPWPGSTARAQSSLRSRWSAPVSRWAAQPPPRAVWRAGASPATARNSPCGPTPVTCSSSSLTATSSTPPATTTTAARATANSAMAPPGFTRASPPGTGRSAEDDDPRNFHYQQAQEKSPAR